MLRRLLAVAVLVVGFASLINAAPAAPTTRPLNILWLTVEDMSPWLNCYGDTTAPTPNIDRLARQGVRYTNVFATTPVCAPARHTLITGLYATSDGAMHMRNHSPSGEALARDPHAYDNIPSYEAVPPPDVRCFSEWLRIAGYYASNNPKEDYQFVAPPTAWDDSSRTGHYKNRKAGQPFFAVFNCMFTHESQGFDNAPKRSKAVKPTDVKVPPYYPDTPAVRHTLAQTYNNIVAMDKWLGEKLDELEKDGLADSTIVFFFSDHGVGLPRGKRNCYDSGLRVPLIIRFPDGHGGGSSDDRLISFLDFAPTVLSLAGIEPKPYMRGRPFLGRFATDPPPYVFATQDRMDTAMDTVRSVSDGRFRYIRNLMPQVPYLPHIYYRDHIPMMKDLDALKRSGKATEHQWQIVADHKPPEEFYDSRSDPHDVKNLIDAPEQRARIDAMRKALDEWTKQTGDLGLIQPEAKIVREKLWPPDATQPTTATPVATFHNGTMTIECATDGASIGYRKRGKASWAVYTAPVGANESGATYEIEAHRIGFKPSPVITAVVAY
jgi:arylsulfatase A-like enzyme